MTTPRDRYGARCDLYLCMAVYIREHLTRAQRELYQKLRALAEQSGVP